MNKSQVGKTAVAVFVKTPGVSPLKTRLAAGIGDKAAAEFYRLSIAAVAAQLARVKSELGIEPFWAIAENSEVDHPLWGNQKGLWTGPGDLGERQSQVYDTLSKDYSRVILLGADTPQICALQFTAALQALEENAFVFGPAHDGGYFMFAGSETLPRIVWQDIPWSTAKTRAVFAAKLPQPAAIIAPLMDVDEAEDLRAMQTELEKVPETLLVPEQIAMLAWLKRYTNHHREHKISRNADG